MAVLNIPTAEVFEPLLYPARYKGAHGGRGSGKSHFFAGLMIEDSLAEKGLLSVCIREVQKTLKDSAKRLLEKKLSDFRLGEADGFKVYEDRIKTPGDGVVIFQGMQDHTAESIKSLEGFKRAWVEEGQSLSERSLTLLRPTIRESGSELWFSWNPRRKVDPVDAMLRGDVLPTGAVVVQANWKHNPWFPAELEQERLDCQSQKPGEYEHIWEGGYATVTAGAYYALQIAQARSEGRVGHVAADPMMTYRAIFDIGGTGKKADAVSIWIAQWIGREIRWLNYYEAQGQPLATHVAWLRAQGYVPSNTTIILPHDGVHGDKVFDVSYQSALMGAGYEVEVIENQGKGAAMQRVEAARRLFPSMWFNEPTTAGGVEAIAAYCANIDTARGIDLGPLHNWASHGADAFGLGCIAYEQPRQKRETMASPMRRVSNGWMG